MGAIWQVEEEHQRWTLCTEVGVLPMKKHQSALAGAVERGKGVSQVSSLPWRALPACGMSQRSPLSPDRAACFLMFHRIP